MPRHRRTAAGEGAGRLSMWATLLLLACGAPPDYAALWATDPAASRDAIQTLTDPLEREAAVFSILELYPEASTELCALLPPGPGLDRCEKLRARPHLWTPATQRAPARQDRTRLKLPDSMTRRFAGVQADRGDCIESDYACLNEAARALSARGELESAAARCRASADARWQQECYFAAAEAAPEGPDRAQDSLSLCAGAASYMEMCVGHALLGLQSDDLAVAPARARALEAALGEHAGPIVALFWCQAAHRLLERQPAQFSQARALWGEAAAPHLRSAVALSVAGEPDPMAAYEAVFAGGDPPQLRLGADRATERLLWHRDFPGEEAIAAIPMLHNGADRRATAADGALDGRLAVLSAMGHAPTPDLVALAAALGDPEPLIRWTAARILSQLSPDHPALKQAAADADPLVKGRSKAGFAANQSRNKKPLRR